MANNDFNGEKILKSMANAQGYLEKALKLDNEGLRKKIEFMSKVMHKFAQNPKKRILKKIAKKNGMPFEIFKAGLMISTNMFKEALDNFDNNELREFIELYIKQARMGIDFLFGE